MKREPLFNCLCGTIASTTTACPKLLFIFPAEASGLYTRCYILSFQSRQPWFVWKKTDEKKLGSWSYPWLNGVEKKEGNLLKNQTLFTE